MGAALPRGTATGTATGSGTATGGIASFGDGSVTVSIEGSVAGTSEIGSGGDGPSTSGMGIGMDVEPVWSSSASERSSARDCDVGALDSVSSVEELESTLEGSSLSWV